MEESADQRPLVYIQQKTAGKLPGGSVVASRRLMNQGPSFGRSAPILGTGSGKYYFYIIAPLRYLKVFLIIFPDALNQADHKITEISF